MAGGHGEAPRVSRATLEAPELPAPLSPLGYLHRDPGSEVILESRNGAICTLAATGAQAIIAAALVNAAAVGARICQMLRGGGAVSVVACGERWVSPGEDGALRFALEDYLGAGAVLHGIGCGKSPEAAVCESAYLQSLGDLESILLRCGSAVELVDKGYSDDVGHASRLDIYSNVPLLRDGVFVPS
jgi:2-phosphosulfolactate phosphatase